MNASSDVCHDWDEDPDHIFRKCAKAVLDAFFPIRERRDFDGLGFERWLSINVRSKAQSNMQTDWRTLFAIIVWWLWHWRNDAVNGERIKKSIGLPNKIERQLLLSLRPPNQGYARHDSGKIRGSGHHHRVIGQPSTRTSVLHLKMSRLDVEVS